MRKFLSVVLSAVLLLSLTVCAAAEENIETISLNDGEVHVFDSDVVSSNGFALDVRSRTEATVNGNVSGAGSALGAVGGSTVTVSGNVASVPVIADVTMGEEVHKALSNCAVLAEASTVMIDGDASAPDADALPSEGVAEQFVFGVSAGEGSSVLVCGDARAGKLIEDVVNISSISAGIKADDSFVMVGGNAEGQTFSINASGSRVVVGGDAVGSILCLDSMKSAAGSTVLVEGTAEGDVSVSGAASALYVGRIAGEISGKEAVHYLISTDNGKIKAESENVLGEAAFSEEETASGKTYVSTLDAGALSMLTTYGILTLTSTTGEDLEIPSDIPGIDACVYNGRGSYTLFIDFRSFRGGLEDVKVISGSSEGKGAFVNREVDENAVFEIEVPVETFDENMLSPTPKYSVPGDPSANAFVSSEYGHEVYDDYEINDHIGLTFHSDFIQALGASAEWISVKHNGTEPDFGGYSVYNHHDGSMSIVFSNSYLQSLGPGEQYFQIGVGGKTVDFTTVVA